MALNQHACMPVYKLEARNYLITCFVVSLIWDETIQGRSIRHTTVRNYVNTEISLHIDRSLPSPHYTGTNYIKIVLKAVSKFEKQSNQRDMVHGEMVHHIKSQHHLYPRDTLKAALTAFNLW